MPCTHDIMIRMYIRTLRLFHKYEHMTIAKAGRGAAGARAVEPSEEAQPILARQYVGEIFGPQFELVQSPKV